MAVSNVAAVERSLIINPEARDFSAISAAGSPPPPSRAPRVTRPKFGTRSSRSACERAPGVIDPGVTFLRVTRYGGATRSRRSVAARFSWWRSGAIDLSSFLCHFATLIRSIARCKLFPRAPIGEKPPRNPTRINPTPSDGSLNRDSWKEDPRARFRSAPTF